ncbi:MAG: hypothetical protein LRY55_09650 [Leadbetterella sp.]|nr:hypothetical protein [Leadbetterella sp.]
MKKYGKLCGIVALTFLFQACGETGIPDPNPGGSPGLDFSININQSPFTPLQNVGGSAIATQQKVIIARLDATNWAALSSYCPNDPTVSLTYNAADFTFRCSKDNSVFDHQGKVKSGSSSNLTRYNTTFTNNTGVLRIFE